MNTTIKARIWSGAGWVAATAALLGAAALLALGQRYSNFAHVFPGCVVLEWTGLYCPSCGMTRAVLALARLDIAAMLRYNLLSPVVLAFFAYLHVGWARWAFLGKPFAQWLSRMSNGMVFAVLGALLLFMALRNLPFEALAFLRP